MDDMEILKKIRFMRDQIDNVPEQGEETNEKLAHEQEHLLCVIYNELENWESEIDPTGDLRAIAKNKMKLRMFKDQVPAPEGGGEQVNIPGRGYSVQSLHSKPSCQPELGENGGHGDVHHFD